MINKIDCKHWWLGVALDHAPNTTKTMICILCQEVRSPNLEELELSARRYATDRWLQKHDLERI